MPIIITLSDKLNIVFFYLLEKGRKSALNKNLFCFGAGGESQYKIK